MSAEPAVVTHTGRWLVFPDNVSVDMIRRDFPHGCGIAKAILKDGDYELRVEWPKSIEPEDSHLQALLDLHTSWVRRGYDQNHDQP